MVRCGPVWHEINKKNTKKSDRFQTVVLLSKRIERIKS